MAVVTIGGPTGGGGRLIGPLVAERLGSDYVDRLILANAARQVGATVEALHQREERPVTMAERFSATLQRLLERSALAGAGGDPYFGAGTMVMLAEEFEELPRHTITRGHEVEDEEYIKAIRSVVVELAKEGNVVIVKRGGAIILRDVPGVLRVGTVASIEDRLARVIERDRLDPDEARKVVGARDKARADYFKRYFRVANPDDPLLYHLMINTSDVDIDYAVDIVVKAVADLEQGRLRPKVGATAGP